MLLPSKLLEKFLIVGVDCNSEFTNNVIHDKPPPTTTIVQPSSPIEQSQDRSIHEDSNMMSTETGKFAWANFSIDDMDANDCLPIVDIVIIHKGRNNACPPGYRIISEHIYPSLRRKANLKDSNIRLPLLKSSDRSICYRRGADKLPICEIGVLYDGRDKPLQGVQVLYKTVDGESANLNASLFPNYPVYLTFRRIDKISMLYHYEPCAISYIGLLIGVSEDDQLPLTYVKFSRNLNKGAIGFSVYLFYRKMIIKHHRLTLKPKVLYTYPKETDDQTHTFDIEAISGFCFPLDAHIEACDTSDYTDPSKLSKSKFNSFVLKGINGDKIYGYTLIVYEVINAQDIIDKYREYLSENTFIPSSQCTTFRATKCLCLLTKLPLPEVMRSLLSLIQKQLDNTFLTDTSCNGNIFRYLRHLFEDLPMLSKSCHNLYFQYERPINLSLPDEMINAGIQSAGNISFLLGLIGIENLLNTFTIIILEGKLLVHSFSSNILVTAVESISRLIFPLQWQCAYIPSCPLNFSKVFESPVPFIAGINSSYFQTNAMPNDVACLDLDYSRLCWARQDFSITWKHLPSRFVKLLRGRILQTSSDFRNFISNTNKRSEYVFAKLKKELSLREAFIQFMASILLDYRMYVSKSDGITLQSQECFNQRRFIQNIPFHSAEFFLSVIQTQAFNRFIEETFDPSNIPQSHVLFDAFLTKIHDATMMSTDSVTVSSGLFSIKSSNNANFTTVVMLPPDLQSNGVSHMQSSRLMQNTLLNDSFNKLNDSSVSMPELCRNLIMFRSEEERARERVCLASITAEFSDRVDSRVAIFFAYDQILMLHKLVILSNTENRKMDSELLRKGVRDASKVALFLLNNNGISNSKIIFTNLLKLCVDYRLPCTASHIWLALRQTHLANERKINMLHKKVWLDVNNRVAMKARKPAWRTLLYLSMSCRIMISSGITSILDKYVPPSAITSSKDVLSSFQEYAYDDHDYQMPSRDSSMFSNMSAPVTLFSEQSNSKQSTGNGSSYNLNENFHNDVEKVCYCSDAHRCLCELCSKLDRPFIARKKAVLNSQEIYVNSYFVFAQTQAGILMSYYRPITHEIFLLSFALKRYCLSKPYKTNEFQLKYLDNKSLVTAMHPLYIDRKLDDDLVQCFREPFIYSDASSEYVSLNHEDTPPQFQHEYDLSNEEEFKKEDEIYMFTHMPSRISGAINLSQKFDDESSRRLISLEHTHSNFDKRTDVTKDQLSLPDINLPFIVPSQYRIFLKLPQLDVADFYNHISDTAKNNILRQTDLNQVDMSSCTRCSLCLNTIYEDDIVCMWALNDLDCSVKCNQCQSKITPKLTIKYTGSLPTDVTNEKEDIDVTSSLPIQEGVQFQLPELCQIKDKVQIKVPYLNPMCLRRLIEITISKDSIIQHELLSGDHAIILWNLMWIHARFTNDESLSQLFSIKIRCFWRLPEFEDNITARVPLYLIKRHLCKESNPVHFDSQSSILSMNIRRLSCVGHLVLQIYRFLQLNDIYSAIEVTVYLMHSGRWPFLNSEVVVNIQLLFKEILFIYMDLKQSTINSDDNGNSKNQDVNDHINFDLYDFFYEQFRKAIEITPVLWNLNDKPCVHLLQMKRDYRKMFHRIRL